MRNRIKPTSVSYLASVAGILTVTLAAYAAPASAASNSTFNQSITAGVLAADILDAARTPVTTPAVAMTAKAFAFECQTAGTASTGAFGSNTERVYVTNPSAANNGWTLTVAATGGATAQWSNGGATSTFDFNDSGNCTDAGDTDSRPGQMTVNANAGTLIADCAACTTTNVTKGSSAAFNQGTTDSVTLLNAAAASDDSWRGYLTGAAITQSIPAEQSADAYTLNMTLTVAAS